MTDFDVTPIPFFQDDEGRKYLTGLQLVQDPALAEFVKRYHRHFSTPVNEDIYVFQYNPRPE